LQSRSQLTTLTHFGSTHSSFLIVFLTVATHIPIHTYISYILYNLPYATGRLLLADRYPKLKDVVLDEDNITLALNEEYVTGTKPLKQGDVVALIPPISGG
jgi:ThiS family